MVGNEMLSAKRLGEKIFLTAEEMNTLLKESGYLKGEPGNYSPTEKAMEYVSEKSWDNGYGGYALRGYSYNVWNEKILDKLDTSSHHREIIRELTANNRKERNLLRKKTYEEQLKSTIKIKDEEINNSFLNSKYFITILAFVGLSLGCYFVIKYIKKNNKKNEEEKEQI